LAVGALKPEGIVAVEVDPALVLPREVTEVDLARDQLKTAKREFCE